MVRKVHLNLRR